MGIALWIVPPPAEASKLKQLMNIPPVIDTLPFPLPSFEPHITLASFPSTIPVATLKLALQTQMSSGSESEPERYPTTSRLHAPLRITFTALVASDHFFRSVLLDVALTPSLTSLRVGVQRAVEHLLGTSVDARSPRFPHVSLFYVPDAHAEERERIRDTLWTTCGVQGSEAGSDTESEAIALAVSGGLNSSRKNGPLLTGFEASEIWIVRCDGPVEGWEVLDKVSLVPSS
ncbi:LigT-like protein [Phellopilus nigrolimitatus]|nr:LigT-like protein [Phellopilus nigrolimitatus]